MTPLSIVVWFNRAFRNTGLQGCSSHSGRRTFITRAARLLPQAGGSLRDVQLLAGHASITTTQRYIDGDSEAQRKLVAAAVRGQDMGARTTVPHRPVKPAPPPQTGTATRTSAIDHAVRVIYRVCCLAGSTSLLDDIRVDLAAEGVRAAIRCGSAAEPWDSWQA